MSVVRTWTHSSFPEMGTFSPVQRKSPDARYVSDTTQQRLFVADDRQGCRPVQPPGTQRRRSRLALVALRRASFKGSSLSPRSLDSRFVSGVPAAIRLSFAFALLRVGRALFAPRPLPRVLLRDPLRVGLLLLAVGTHLLAPLRDPHGLVFVSRAVPVSPGGFLFLRFIAGRASVDVGRVRPPRPCPAFWCAPNRRGAEISTAAGPLSRRRAGDASPSRRHRTRDRLSPGATPRALPSRHRDRCR